MCQLCMLENSDATSYCVCLLARCTLTDNSDAASYCVCLLARCTLTDNSDTLAASAQMLATILTLPAATYMYVFAGYSS